MKKSTLQAGAQDEQYQQLAKIYFDPNDPGSLGGAERLYQRAKQLHLKGVSRRLVKGFLSAQSAYTLHKQARRHFTRNHTYVQGIDDQWQADLVDMQEFSRHNSGIKYLLTVIDVFSKYAWVIPLKRKTAEDLVAAFKILFKQSGPRKPRRLQTDKGKEFVNSKVLSLLKNTYHIRHFASWSDQKAAVVERFNRTLKSRMWRYFSQHQTNHYLDVLPALVHSYNHSVHRAIGREPASVRAKHEQEIARRLYGSESVRRRRRRPLPLGRSRERPRDGDLVLGTKVRVSRVKGVFEKGYEANWSDENFRIREIQENQGGERVYKLADESGESIEGSWYKHELLPIPVNRYFIEKIIRKRLSDSSSNPQGTYEALVKWRGWPSKFNSWVPESELDTYRGK